MLEQAGLEGFNKIGICEGISVFDILDLSDRSNCWSSVSALFSKVEVWHGTCSSEHVCSLLMSIFQIYYDQEVEVKGA